MAGGDSVDSTAFRFLVKKALERQKEEEELEKEKVMKELDVLMRIPFIQLTPDQRAVVDRPGAFQDWKAWSAASSAGRRKKKRKKKKLPKSSSGPLHRQGWRRSLRGRSWPVWTRRTVAVAFSRLVFLVTIHLALCFVVWQGWYCW